ncbi:MAG: hypothetical protein CSA65_00675 [Proteobacteria bacterium]|nr:MAG: hypothetical protein CSA65_00675 [Pseudomonadota bacterium]
MLSRSTLSRLALATLASTFLGGARCASVSRPYAAPTAAQVEAAVRKRGAAVRALRAEARMSYVTKQGKVKATVRMMAAAGGKLRFDVVSPFDTPLATLVTSEGSFALVDSQKSRHFHGPATPCNIGRLLRVQLQPKDVLTILGGSTPLIAHTSRSLRWDDRAGVEELTLVGRGGVKQTVRLDGRDKRWRLISSRISDAKGKLLLALTAADYETQKALALPTRIKVSQPSQKAELELDFKKQELNITLPSVAFERPAAGGLPSQRVDCDTEIRLPKALDEKGSKS